MYSSPPIQEFNRIKLNEEELYDYIFKSELRKTIFVDLPQTEEILRRCSVFIAKQSN